MQNTPVREWIKQYRTTFEDYNDFFKEKDWRAGEEVYKDYLLHKDISIIVIDRLKYFVTKFDPYLKQKSVKSFMDIMLSSVNIFLDRVNDYYTSPINSWKNMEDLDRQRTEMNFQAEIISDYNKIKDKLFALNLDDTVTVLDIPIHSDKKIPMLMAETVEEKFPKITEFIKTNTDYPALTTHDILNNTEFFKNIKKPPKYDLTKHYFEQDKDVIQFYQEELHKIRNGVTIAGVKIHPWLYWHINYFKTDIPMEFLQDTPLYNPNKKRLITSPFLRDNELFFADSYQEADEKNVGLFLFGSRRWAKTIIEASVLTWRTTIIENSESLVIGGDKGDLEKLSKSLEIGFSNVNPAFRLPRNNNDWNKMIQFGLKDKAQNRIPYSDVFIRNVDGGKAGSSEKTAGATPTAWIADEAGKFACKEMYQAAIPSFQNPDGWALVALLSGTGGNVTLSADAQSMLLDPVANDILPMNWDRLENYVGEEELITWKQRSFGLFLPGQMSFKSGLKKIDTNLADFFKIDNKRLRVIDLKITDWRKAKETMQADRDKKSKDRDALNKERMYHPFDPLECFLSRIENPFCAAEALEHRTHLIETGNVGRPVTISRRNGTTNLNTTFSDKIIADYPFEGGNIDAPVIIYDDPPDDNDMDGTYVAGLDHYKHDKSSTDSIGSLYVFKRNVNLDEWSGRIVCSYASRPDRIETFNQICELIIEGYGAECLQENADISFEQHLRAKGKDQYLLASGEDFAKAMISPTAKQNNKLGLNPSSKNKDYLLKLAISYCNEDIVVGTDENGNDIVKKGVTRIPDIALLKEIIDFNYSGNFDRLTSFSHALAWQRYLDSLGIMPKVKLNRKDNEFRKQMRRHRIKHNSPYSTLRSNPYKK